MMAKEESVFPVFLDNEDPLPGEMVIFVIVSELGLDGVRAAGQHPLGCLLHGGEEFVFLVWPGSVAADHVLCLVNCTLDRERKFICKRLLVV